MATSPLPSWGPRRGQKCEGGGGSAERGRGLQDLPLPTPPCETHGKVQTLRETTHTGQIRIFLKYEYFAKKKQLIFSKIFVFATKKPKK